MKKFILGGSLFLMCTSSWCHEQWLLSVKEIQEIYKIPQPTLLNQFTLFNWITISLFALFCGIFITRPPPLRTKITQNQIDGALLSIRLSTSVMLILCALGLLPKVTIPALGNLPYLLLIY